MELTLDSKEVSLIKAITWRVIASLDTALIAYFFTRSFTAAVTISGLEVLTKTALFYFHERGFVQLQKKTRLLKKLSSHQMSWLKAISWRFFGTLDTILISFFITSQVNASLMIGLTELMTKIILYFFHERLWVFLLQKINTHALKKHPKIKKQPKAFLS